MEHNKNEIIISTPIHKKNNKNRSKTLQPPQPPQPNTNQYTKADREHRKMYIEYRQLQKTANKLMDEVLMMPTTIPDFKSKSEIEYQTNNKKTTVQVKKGSYNTVFDFNTNKDVVLRLSNMSRDFGLEMLKQESYNSAFNDVFISSLLALCGEPTKKRGKSHFKKEVPYFFMEKAETDAQSIADAIDYKLKNKQNLDDWEKTHHLLLELMWLFSTTEMQPVKLIIKKKDKKTNTIVEEKTKELTEEDKINAMRDTFYEEGFSQVKEKIARLFLRIFLFQMCDRKPANTLLFTKTKKGETKANDTLWVETDFDDVKCFYSCIFGKIKTNIDKNGKVDCTNHVLFEKYFQNLLNQYNMFKQVLQEKSIEKNLRNIIKKVSKSNNLPNDVLLAIKNLSIEIRKKNNKDIEQTKNLLKQHTEFAQQLKNINLNIVDVVEQIDANLFNYEIETEFLDCFKETTKQYTMTPEKLLTLVEDIAKKCRYAGLPISEAITKTIKQLETWHNMLCCMDEYVDGYCSNATEIQTCLQNIANSVENVDFIKEARNKTLKGLNQFMPTKKEQVQKYKQIEQIVQKVYNVQQESLQKNYSYIKLNTKINITGLSGDKNNSINK